MADDLLDRAFDRQPPGPASAPVRPYLVCGTPRSGTTLLCEGLRATGRLGVPTEYFNIGASIVPLGRRWASPTVEAYVRDLYRFRTSEEGVFGTKLHWQQVEEMRDDLGLGRLAGEDLGSPQRERVMLETLFPGARHVHVQRNDRDRQAVSYWLAEHTRQWSVHHGEEPPASDLPVYDYRAIDALRGRIDHGEASWARYFTETGVEPLRVAYEDLCESYCDEIARVGRALGIAIALDQVIPSQLKRQANGYSEEILERYRAERGPSACEGHPGDDCGGSPSRTSW